MPDDRDPLRPFWVILEKRFRVLAVLMRRRFQVSSILHETDDCVQIALFAAQKFSVRRKIEEGTAFAVSSEFLEECVRYGLKSMRNALLAEMSTPYPALMPFSVSDMDADGDPILDLPDLCAHTDLQAVALDWVSRMRSQSKSATFQRMLDAFVEMVKDGFPNISVRDIADRANVGDKDLYRFKSIVKGTLE
ncbi:hypothetical protein [Sphingomonas sp. R1]|uniref:hypothetical protein n=1 Tax=Sphingomonas sp. R1 TaxID=399176 RepID=UPI002224D5E6|nr:hypothetical protein [Sphingomonas sp. R1]UYY78421.1 hypothetical protein OIM94_05310 [Sphingomonas sp. R1]